MNPLLEDFNTAPFSKISSTDYKPAIKKAIDICKKEIVTIISNPETPSFKNTTEALEFLKLGVWGFEIIVSISFLQISIAFLIAGL